ncbi:unnamed protein product, partial [Laminaria digitata]
MPFFETSPPSRTAAEIAAAPSSPAASFGQEERSTQPPGGTDKLAHHRQGTPNARGQSDPDGTAGGARGAIGSAQQQQYGGASASSCSECCSPDCCPDTVEEYDGESRIHRPPAKPIPRCGHEAKRIRFTGAIGEFLDGPSLWGDLAVMEAERKVGQADAATGKEGA